MIISFDIETAKLAILGKTGKIITRTGNSVEITTWNGELDLAPIEGYANIPHKVSRFCRWSEEGVCLNTIYTEFDLFIEVDDSISL